MVTLRRFLVVVGLSFWLGGFTFYVSVVVPIGTRVLESALAQGMITRQVTVWLNVAGACALVVLLWDVLTADQVAWRRLLRRGLWLFILFCQVALFLLHAHLDAMIDPVAETISDRDAFYRSHRLYLWLHTFQWAAALVFIVLMLKCWQAEDRSRAGQMR